MIIRLEEKRDYLEVENLVRNAFWNLYRPGAYEHYIVHNLRNDKSFIQKLAYVIEKDNKIIGHINYSKGKLKFGNGKCEDAVVLGPISIDKDYELNINRNQTDKSNNMLESNDLSSYETEKDNSNNGLDDMFKDYENNINQHTDVIDNFQYKKDID